ncbi:MAG: hypothetical protein CMJ29_02835 [Phycisphaerae bacterium]|nr:hypothetical protein [Phycisphaerae bacterium]
MICRDMPTRRSKSKSSSKNRRLNLSLATPANLWTWSRTSAGRSTWLGIGVTAAVITFICFIPAMGRRVEKPVEHVTVRFEHPPIWAGPSLLDHLQSLGESQLQGTSLSRADLEATRDQLLSSGFFHEILQVRRSGQNEVTVDATLVTPMARVRDRHGTTLIDQTARVLPPGCGVSGDVHVVTIINPRYSRPTSPGDTWNGGDLSAAMRVLDHIQQAHWIHQVQAIDLSRYPATGSLVLITDNGSRVIWGSAPGDEKAMESLLDRKVARLDRLYQISGRIDQYHPGEIDITDASVVVKR